MHLTFEPQIEKILVQLEETSGRFWNISRDSAVFIHSLLKGIKARKVLEIGTSNGYSGLWIALALKLNAKEVFETGDVEKAGDDRQYRLFTVESHPGRFNLAQAKFEQAGILDFVMQVKGHAPEVLGQVTEIVAGGFDLIFLDATKAEHTAYLQAVLPLVKTGGYIVADNVFSHQEKMQLYIEFANKNPELISMVLPIGTGLMVSQKK